MIYSEGNGKSLWSANGIYLDVKQTILAKYGERKLQHDKKFYRMSTQQLLPSAELQVASDTRKKAA